MTWTGGGNGGGGVWGIELGRRKARIEMRTGDANALDRLYVPLVPHPKKSKDFSNDLVWDAAARLEQLLRFG